MKNSRIRTVTHFLLLGSALFCMPLQRGTAQVRGGHAAEGPLTTLSAPQRRVVFSGPFAANMVIPHWDNGYLVSWDLEAVSPSVPNVRLYDAQGNKTIELTVWIPGSTGVVLSNVLVTPGGRLIATGFAEQKDSAQAFFIAESDRTGKVTRVVRTNPYVPERMCTAQDGTVWTAGGIRSDDQQARDAAPVLRHFDLSQGLIESYVPRSFFGTRRDIAGNLGPRKEAFLGCTTDRVFLYSGATDLYVELKISDHSVGRWKIDRSLLNMPLNGFALAATGEFYSSLYDQENPSADDGLYYLQRNDSSSTVRWTAVGSEDSNAFPMQSFDYLYGADGIHLVHSRKDGDVSTLYWSAPSSRHVAKLN